MPIEDMFAPPSPGAISREWKPTGSIGSFEFAGTKHAGPPTVEFDGHQFNPRIFDGSFLALLEMAYRARRGDPVAVQLLTAFAVVIPDEAGGMYWPVQADKQLQQVRAIPDDTPDARSNPWRDTFAVTSSPNLPDPDAPHVVQEPATPNIRRAH